MGICVWPCRFRLLGLKMKSVSELPGTVGRPLVVVDSRIFIFRCLPGPTVRISRNVRLPFPSPVWAWRSGRTDFSSGLRSLPPPLRFRAQSFGRGVASAVWGNLRGLNSEKPACSGTESRRLVALLPAAGPRNPAASSVLRKQPNTCRNAVRSPSFPRSGPVKGPECLLQP
jgi:hypothetical protein